MLNETYTRFLLVAEAGSFSKAAQALYVSPVAVRKQINALEDQVGVRLLDRSNQGVQLTPAGRILAEGVRDLQTTSEDLLTRVRAAGQRPQKVIRLGMSLMHPGTKLIELWQEKAAALTDFSLQIVPFSDDEVPLTKLASRLGRDFDLIVSGSDAPVVHDQLQVHQLGTYPFLLAVPQNHPLSANPRLTFADLAGETLLLPPRDAAPAFDQLCHDLATNHPAIHFVTTDQLFTTNIYNDYANRDYLILIQRQWQYLSPTMLVKPVAWDYGMSYGLIYSREPSPAVAEFVRRITE